MQLKHKKQAVFEGELLETALEDLSDFAQKHGGEKKKLPEMMFDEHNCDLFDNVRPIRWTDPTYNVSDNKHNLTFALEKV